MDVQTTTRQTLLAGLPGALRKPAGTVVRRMHDAHRAAGVLQFIHLGY